MYQTHTGHWPDQSCTNWYQDMVHWYVPVFRRQRRRRERHSGGGRKRRGNKRKEGKAMEDKEEEG